MLRATIPYPFVVMLGFEVGIFDLLSSHYRIDKRG